MHDWIKTPESGCEHATLSEAIFGQGPPSERKVLRGAKTLRLYSIKS